MDNKGIVYEWLKSMQSGLDLMCWARMANTQCSCLLLPRLSYPWPHCPSVMALSSPESVVASGSFLTQYPRSHYQLNLLVHLKGSYGSILDFWASKGFIQYPVQSRAGNWGGSWTLQPKCPFCSFLKYTLIKWEITRHLWFQLWIKLRSLVD